MDYLKSKVETIQNLDNQVQVYLQKSGIKVGQCAFKYLDNHRSEPFIM